MAESEDSECVYEYTPPGMHEFLSTDLEQFECTRDTIADSEYCLLHARNEGKSPEIILESRQKGVKSLYGCYLRSCVINNEFRTTSDEARWIFPEIDFKNCVLAESDFASGLLMSVDFSNSNINESNFSSCNLSGAVFHESKAINADFSEANLTKVDFSKANLKEATLTDAHLFSADLSCSQISNPDFGEANLEGADFTDASIRNTDFTDTETNNTSFSEAHISKSVDFSGCDLRECDFSNTSLDFVDLSGANLRGVNLTGARLGHANLSNTDLREAKLNDTYLEGANLEGANLKWAELRNAILSDAILHSADLRQAKFDESSMHDADLSDSDARGAVFCETSLEGANLKNADFRGSDLQLAAMYNSVLENVIINEQTEFDEICVYERASDKYLQEQEKDWGLGSASKHRIKTNRLEKAEWVYRQWESLSRVHSLPKQAQKFYIRQKNARRKHVWKKTVFYKHIFQHYPSNQHENEDEDSPSSTKQSRLAGDNRRQKVFPRVQAAIEKVNRFKTYAFNVPLLRSIWNEFHRWTTLYGESPWRVITVSMTIIIIWAFSYPFTQGVNGNRTYSYSATTGPEAQVEIGTVLMKSLYFSLSAFTTVGFGDLTPVGTASQWLAGTESFLGALLIALLVFTLGRRVTR